MGKSLSDYGFVHRTKINDGSNNCHDDKDYSNASINGCKQSDSSFFRTNLQYAAITGGIFTACAFHETQFDNADLEFCNFSNCNFKDENISGVSFNNSDFIGTSFFNISMKSVTMTGCFLDNCLFDNVSIFSSTFENACFKKCKLKNMDLRNLNMEFMELIEPEMENVILPSSQVPYMFGCLEYLLKVPSNVYLSAKDDDTISVSEYLNEYLPLLKEHYKKEQEFFPLANIYMAESIVNDDDDSFTEAINAIYNGIMQNNTQQDYRLLKFYIKLITNCKKIDNGIRHSLYAAICSLNNENESLSPAARNYRKHIAEIKSYLFSNGHKMSSIKFITNILIKHPKIGNILETLYDISRFNNTGNIEISLSQNSPLCIEIKFFGDENKIESNIEQLSKLDASYMKEKLKLLKYNNDKILDIAREFYEQGIFLYLWEINIGSKKHIYYNNAFNHYSELSNLLGKING